MLEIQGIKRRISYVDFGHYDNVVSYRYFAGFVWISQLIEHAVLILCEFKDEKET